MKPLNHLLLSIFLLLPAFVSAQQYTTVNGQKQFADLADWGAYHGGEFALGVGLTSSPSHPAGGGSYTKDGTAVGGTLLVTMNPYISSGFDYTYAGFRTPGAVKNIRYTLEAQEVFAALNLNGI